MASKEPTQLEKESLEAHVDLCALRYENLDNRPSHQNRNQSGRYPRRYHKRQ